MTKNMQIGLVGIIIFSLFALMIIPAYADVTSLSLEKSFYLIDEKIKFVGTQEKTNVVFVTIYDSSGSYVGMLAGSGENEFSTIPKTVSEIFEVPGIFSATAFTNQQSVETGITIKLKFDEQKIFVVPDFILQLNSISDKTVEVEKTVTFTASINDDSVKDVIFSLHNEPSGAVIDQNSGKFVWTPSKSHGNIKDVKYNFDVIVSNDGQEDIENITITVKKAYVEPEIKSTPTFSEPEIKEEIKDNGLAGFVDETKDPQSYVDRYNNESIYKEWFDDNYPQYASIYEAVGLEEPLKIPAGFVDETKDPQSYVDRYNNESIYKEWFDDNYPQYASIYEAVGLEEPVLIEPEFGECGIGTKLVDGKCTVIESKKTGGGCLIATATYGSEMATQVQQLREIRDNQLLNTESGKSFVNSFNDVYYSFSPIIADYERENPVFKKMVKLAITPMISSLSIMSMAESDFEVVSLGIGVILLNLGMYIGIPVVAIIGIKKVHRVKF